MSGIVGIKAICHIKLWLKQKGYPTCKHPEFRSRPKSQIPSADEVSNGDYVTTTCMTLIMMDQIVISVRSSNMARLTKATLTLAITLDQIHRIL